MKILSVRKGFHADHSSTSYEFLAIDKTLDPSQRKKVASLSSRARPTKRKVSFVYNGEWNDLPGGWLPLMEKYYDVMYSESYDWWTLAIAFDADAKTIQCIKEYEFEDIDELGITINAEESRAVITISCRLSPDFGYNEDDYYDDDEEYDSEETVESDNYLLNLLAENRNYLKKGDCRLLYGVWQKYGFEAKETEESKEDMPPEPAGMNKLPEPIKELLSLLEQI